MELRNQTLSNRSGLLLVILATFMCVNLLEASATLLRSKRQGFVFQPEDGKAEACTTKDGQVGSCIEVAKCDEATRILSAGRLNAEQRRFLQDRTCRFEGATPFFCCVTTRTGAVTQAPPVTPNPVPVTVAPPVTPPPTPPPAVTVRETLKELTAVCGNFTSAGIRVVGGEPSRLNQWPWMVALFIAEDGVFQSTFVSCGGVLISRNFVLTAAHCAVNKATGKARPASDFRLRLGDLDINNDTDGANPVELGAASVLPHEEYNAKTIQNDIALIQLDKPVTYTDGIQPICLPTEALRNDLFETKQPTIAGWGTVAFQGDSSSFLQHVSVMVNSNADCQTAYRRFRVTITSSQLCAGFSRGGKDACQGDSGGPLMLPRGNRWFSIGVVSVGFRCAEAGFPGIYARVTSYLDWIAKNAQLS